MCGGGGLAALAIAALFVNCGGSRVYYFNHPGPPPEFELCFSFLSFFSSEKHILRRWLRNPLIIKEGGCEPEMVNRERGGRDWRSTSSYSWLLAGVPRRPHISSCPPTCPTSLQCVFSWNISCKMWQEKDDLGFLGNIKISISNPPPPLWFVCKSETSFRCFISVVRACMNCLVVQ